MNGLSVYSPPNPSSSLQFRPKSASILSRSSRSSNLRLEGLRFTGQKWSRAVNFRCRGSSGPGGSGSGDNDSRTVLDAFFLGKALAEALNERIESTVGEIFSTIGRLQAEQQKQVQEFQEDVLERAKRAKEKAAREAMEAQGLIPKAKTASSPDAGTPATPPVTANGPPSLSNEAGDPIEVPISGESSDG